MGDGALNIGADILHVRENQTHARVHVNQTHENQTHENQTHVNQNPMSDQSQIQSQQSMPVPHSEPRHMQHDSSVLSEMRRAFPILQSM
jgi:hypothetical protein